MEIFIWNVIPRKQQQGEEVEFKENDWGSANKNSCCVVGEQRQFQKEGKPGSGGKDSDTVEKQFVNRESAR